MRAVFTSGPAAESGRHLHLLRESHPARRCRAVLVRLEASKNHGRSFLQTIDCNTDKLNVFW